MTDCPGKLSQFCQELKRIKTYFLLIGLFCLNGHNGFGQDQRVADSLAPIYLEGNLESEEKMELLMDLAFNEMRDRELSLKYAEELIQLSEIEENSKYIFSGLLQNGEYYKKTGELDLALEAYFEAANVAVDAKSLNNEGVVYISIADTYAIMENYSNAVLFYNKSLPILRSEADSIPLASALLNAGDT